MGRFDQIVVKLRWPLILLFTGCTAFFASRIPDAEIDSEMKSMLPDDMPARLHIERIEDLFGGSDMVMLVIEADDVLAEGPLGRLEKMSRRMEHTEGIDRVLSPFTLKDIRSEQGTLVVDPAVKRIPRTPQQREKLRAVLRDNELVYQNVVAEDFTAAAAIGLLQVDADDSETIEALRAIIDEVPGPEPVSIAGMPFMRTIIAQDIQSDMKRFLPIGLAIMLVFLFLCFRQLRGVLLPFLVVVMSILFGLGLVPLLGWKIQMVTILLPVILIAVANDYGIHILARYQEDNLPGAHQSRRELAGGVVRALAVPVLLTGITTIAGLMCLLTHIVVPAKQLGILASAAVGFALLGSLTFIPAVLAILPRAKPIVAANGEEHPRHLLERMLASLAGAVVRRPKHILAASLVVAVGVAVGISLLVVDTNPVHYYDEDAPVARSTALVDKYFGGSGAVSVVAKGDVKDPALLRALDDLEQKLAAMPEVGQTTSIAKVVRRIHRVWFGNTEADKIPDSRAAVAQLLELYMMSGDPEDFERLVDFEYEHALLTARINELSTETISRVMNRLKRDMAERPDGMFPVAGGFVDLLADLVDAIVQGQVISLLLSLVLVTLLVMLLFRSVVAGLLAAIPLAIAMTLLFGLMGFVGIELNIATAMLSSIMIGVGIDYTIHFLWRFREERRAGHPPAQAVHITLTTTGRGITFNALSVMVGFLVVFVSNFLPVQFFGFLVVVSIGSCLFGALGLLPAICLLVKPRFLEPVKK